MPDTASKIKIKMGLLEVEFEGSEAFLKAELPDLLAAVETLRPEAPRVPRPRRATSPAGRPVAATAVDLRPAVSARPIRFARNSL